MSVTFARTRKARRVPTMRAVGDTMGVVGLSIWTAILGATFLALLVSDQVQAAGF